MRNRASSSTTTRNRFDAASTTIVEAGSNCVPNVPSSSGGGCGAELNNSGIDSHSSDSYVNMSRYF